MTQITNIVEGELLRARVKPVDGWYYNALILLVSMQCSDRITAAVTWRADISFGRIFAVEDSAADERGYLLTLFWPGYGSWGYDPRGDGEKMKDFLRTGVSNALTDNLKANFDP